MSAVPIPEPDPVNLTLVPETIDATTPKESLSVPAIDHPQPKLAPPVEAITAPRTSERPLRPEDSLLRIYSDSLDDLEKVRIATTNRIGALEREGLVNAPEHARMKAIADGLEALEHGITLDLQRALRKHPLGPWVRKTIGIGEKQGARLLATIGDPAWNDLHERPRLVSELWSFSGYSVIDGEAPKRKKGQRANWNPQAKMRAFLVAESCIKQSQSPYRPVYDAARAKHADAVHKAVCVRCGPAGKPAPEGSALSLGHQHARALRVVAKEVLRDLWIEANRVHAETDEATS